MEIVTAIGVKMAEYTVAPVRRQIGYVISYNRNIENLKTQVQKLEEAKVGVQHSVEAARRNGEEIEVSVQSWLKKVGDIVAESQRIFHDNVGCLNLLLKHRLSRKAEKMILEMPKILAEGKFNKISYRPTLPVTVPSSSRGYEALQSRTSILSEIMKALKDDNMYSLGVYGMGGVGKTTLVKELAWQAEQDGSFGVVVIATVTNSPDVKKIQGEIADGLGLKFDEETEMGRSKRLRQRLKKENNILVILDDIWDTLDLTQVGIPFGEEHKGCKLLMTSRIHDLLRNKMGTQQEFYLQVLSEQESWSLFGKMAGDTVNDMEIQPTALKVASCCVGLPLLIITVANALKNQEIDVWKDTLKQLTRLDHEGLGSKVYFAIKLSYDHLETNEVKSFFLLISSLRHSSYTYNLLVYGWGLGLYKNVDTLVDARNRITRLTNDLRSSCLLLEGGKDKVEMHDMVYEVAYSIAQRTEASFAMKAHDELKDWPKMDLLKNLHRIILPSCHIKELPERLPCPNLEMLILGSSDNYLKLPNNFLDEMRELKVLHLIRLDCDQPLSSSLSCFTNLRLLCLEACLLGDIMFVSKLSNLEILTLINSDIKELPREIGQLTRLRILDLTNSGVKMIPPNLISSLTSLEELYMGNCFIQWEVEGSEIQSNNASLSELRHLHKLRVLILKIQDASILPKDLIIFGQLERYKILIGDNFEWTWPHVDYFDASKTLKLNQVMRADVYSDHGIKMLLKSVEDLHFTKLKGAQNGLCLLDEERFPQLKHLHIQNSDEIQYIIDSSEWVHPSQHFPNLESLVLQKLINMEKIWHGPFPAQYFTKLKVIKVTGCERLRSVIIYDLVRDLPQLTEVEVSHCKDMTEIIAEGDEKIDKIILPKLRSLTLDCLPMLSSLYFKPFMTDMQLQYFVEEYNDNLPNATVPLFDEKIVFPNLESLKLYSIDLRSIWDDKLATHFCNQNLTSVTINNCNCLKYVLSSRVARELVKLQYLKITNCRMVEDMFVPEDNLPSGTSYARNEDAVFPNLETLVISQMDSLKTIWRTELRPKSFGKLNEMEIAFCKQLSIVFPSYVQKHLTNLETLHIANCEELEVVFEDQELNVCGTHKGTTASKLRALTLEYLPVLNHVFPSPLAKELKQLQFVFISDCGVETIIAKDEVAGVASRFIFPQLTSLALWNLEELGSFYSGIHTLECPKLRRLDVYHCDKLQVFTSMSQNFPVQVEEQPLFSFEKVIPNIEELTLSSKDITLICNTPLRDDCFYTVKAFELQCFHDESDKFPSGFLQRFTNLEKLSVSCSSFKEIFWSESSDIGYSKKNMKLKTLSIKGLRNLEYLFNDKPQTQQILQNLQTLGVYMCPRLKNVVPTSMLFQNLHTLLVMGCARLVNLVTSSSARSLLNLKKLVIGYCEMMEEIVNQEEEDSGAITFMKLECLQLDGLPMLTSFCKGNQNFKFPLLRAIAVVECPLMETFSRGLLSTPLLKQVTLTPNGDVWHWKGDLNTTIATIFKKKNIQNSEED